MRVLLDGNLPRAFAALLPGHRVEIIHQRRWSDLDDGPLLDAAEREFDAFLTADQSLRYQQNLRGRRLRIVVLHAPSSVAYPPTRTTMNFGNFGFTELLFVVLQWALPIALLVWLIRTVSAMSASLREVANRLADVERRLGDTSITAPPNER